MSDKNGVNLERLKKLIDGEKSRQIIADKIECDVSMITKHYNGDRNITLDYVVKYAKYFNVSTDYLLGLSDVATTDTSVKAICDYTGLDENSVDLLHELSSRLIYQSVDFYKDFINNLLSDLLPHSQITDFNSINYSTLIDELNEIVSRIFREFDDITGFSNSDIFEIENNTNSALFGLQQAFLKTVNKFLLNHFSDTEKFYNFNEFLVSLNKNFSDKQTHLFDIEKEGK